MSTAWEQVALAQIQLGKNQQPLNETFIAELAGIKTEQPERRKKSGQQP